jgi:hypothetical protein
MKDGEARAVRIPNWVLIVAAGVLAVMASRDYLGGDRANAMTLLGGAGIFLATLSFSYPALPLWAKIVATPILLAPFAALFLILFNVI